MDRMQQFKNKLLNINPQIHLSEGQEYTNSKSKMEFVCCHGHTWFAIPSKIIQGTGCPHCYRKNKSKLQLKYTIKDIHKMVEERNIVTKNKVFLLDKEYKGRHIKHKFGCENGHTWLSNINNICSKHSGCPECFGNKKYTTETFICALNKKNKNIKLLENEKYINSSTKLKFICKYNHVWSSAPSEILFGYGCPHCVKKPYSKMAIRWLESVSREDKIEIEHAENHGEYLIPGTNYKADGYCRKTNTIYEFNGDAFHGNPKKYDRDCCCHPYDREITAGELYDRTIHKERFLSDMGFNIVVMWESDLSLSG